MASGQHVVDQTAGITECRCSTPQRTAQASTVKYSYLNSTLRLSRNIQRKISCLSLRKSMPRRKYLQEKQTTTDRRARSTGPIHLRRLPHRTWATRGSRQRIQRTVLPSGDTHQLRLASPRGDRRITIYQLVIHLKGKPYPHLTNIIKRSSHHSESTPIFQRFAGTYIILKDSKRGDHAYLHISTSSHSSNAYLRRFIRHSFGWRRQSTYHWAHTSQQLLQ